MNNFLDFRDSIFPYIGLIVTIVIFIVTIIPAILMHHKKTLYWSIGNCVGYFIGWLLLFLIGPSISTAIMKLVIPGDIDIKASTLAPMFNQIIPILWFPVFLLIWNTAVLIPNYFTWYKKVTGLKQLKGTKVHLNKKQVQIKIGMILLSIVAYAPITISSGTLIESATTSQSHINKTSKGVGKTFDALSIITYTNHTRINLDALQALDKIYFSNIDTPDGKQQHPYEFIKDGFSKFFYFDGSSIDAFQKYITTNFKQDTSTNDELHFYVKWLDEDYFAKQFYMNRTVSSLTSQFMLPKELSNAVPELFSNYLDAKNITYEEINAENISLDYTPGGDPTKISLVTLMQQLLAGGDISIKVPNASNPSESDNYHLHLLKNNAPDSRIKILANTYQKLCQKIADKIIEHDGDVADYDKMVALVKDYLARIFFIDHNQDNKPYTNTSQISNTF